MQRHLHCVEGPRLPHVHGAHGAETGGVFPADHLPVVVGIVAFDFAGIVAPVILKNIFWQRI